MPGHGALLCASARRHPSSPPRAATPGAVATTVGGTLALAARSPGMPALVRSVLRGAAGNGGRGTRIPAAPRRSGVDGQPNDPVNVNPAFALSWIGPVRLFCVAQQETVVGVPEYLLRHAGQM